MILNEPVALRRIAFVHGGAPPCRLRPPQPGAAGV